MSEKKESAVGDAAAMRKVENGMEVSIRGKIEDTKPFKGVPYTRLSRPVCTILEKAVA